MAEDNGIVFQRLNYRTVREEHRNWNAFQKERAWSMDRAFATAFKHGLNVRVIIVDGEPHEHGKGQVDLRHLDPEPWHVDAYDQASGWCRLQRGRRPDAPETFSGEEITAAGTFAEGAKVEITAQVRERSVRLRDLARAHFARQSPDGRLDCDLCGWAPPMSIELSGPIVEIHHGIGVSSYAYHPTRTGRRPDNLVIVGRAGLAPTDKSYLERLKKDFNLPLSYRVVTI